MQSILGGFYKSAEMDHSIPKLPIIMIEQRTFHVPGDGKNKVPVTWQLKYDTTHDVRFESMRNPGRHAQLHRRHMDLLKETELKIRAYERRQRMFSAEIKMYTQKVTHRLNTLKKKTNTVNEVLKHKYSYDSLENLSLRKFQSSQNPRVSQPERRTLLFSVVDRHGEKCIVPKGETKEDNSLPTVYNVFPVQRLLVHKQMTM